MSLGFPTADRTESDVSPKGSGERACIHLSVRTQPRIRRCSQGPKTHPQDQPSALGPRVSCSAYSVLLRCRNYRRAVSVALHRTSDDDLLGRASCHPKTGRTSWLEARSQSFSGGILTPRVLVLFVSGRSIHSALGLRNNKGLQKNMSVS